MHLSKEFFELIKSIGESKSKQEEDRIILNEIAVLKKKLENDKPGSITMNIPGAPGGGVATGGNSLNTNKKKAREFLVRVLYVEMLGHDGSFGYIKAVVSYSSFIVECEGGFHDSRPHIWVQFLGNVSSSDSCLITILFNLRN